MNPDKAIAVLLIEAISIQTASNETRPLFKASLLVLLIGMLAGTTASFGQSTNRLRIDVVRQLRLPDVVLESVKSVGSDSKNPKPYLEVNGVIGTSIRFELLLPEDWNGRFVMGGGGGFVGTVQNMARGSVNRGYATVGTDTGHHDESGYLAGWAIDNLEAKVNFGHLAVHRTAEVAKALIRDYYGSDSVVFGRLSARRIFSGSGHSAGSVLFFCDCRHLSMTRP